MIGLPGETDDDLRAIGRLSDQIALERTHLGKGPAKVAVSVSNFVPKASTPFQWTPMASRDEWETPPEYYPREHLCRHRQGEVS